MFYKIDETPALIIRGKVNKASFVDQLVSQFFHEQATLLIKIVREANVRLPWDDTRDQQIMFVRTRCPVHQVCSMLFPSPIDSAETSKTVHAKECKNFPKTVVVNATHGGWKKSTFFLTPKKILIYKKNTHGSSQFQKPRFRSWKYGEHRHECSENYV